MTALTKPQPQPNTQTAAIDAHTPAKSSGMVPSPIMPKPANRMTATRTSVASSSRPRAMITSKVLTNGNCSSEPLLVTAYVMLLLLWTNK
jgi:hypothetical protein